MTGNDLWGLVKAAASGWVDDYAPSMGAALAYYTMFSIAPLLLIAISIAGLVFGEQAARGEIFSQLEGMLGAPGALAVQGLSPVRFRCTVRPVARFSGRPLEAWRAQRCARRLSCRDPAASANRP